MNQRQLRVFGVLIAVLLAAFTLAALSLLGILPLPFGDEFSRKIAYAGSGDTPCPTENSRPVSAAGVQLQVLNASSISGLASDVSGTLEGFGYTIALIDNAPSSFLGSVLLEVGPSSVDMAYTIARYFEPPVSIKLSELPAGTISITLGEGYQGLLPEEELISAFESRSALVPLAQCLPVDPDDLQQLPQQSDSQSGVQSGAQSGESEG